MEYDIKIKELRIDMPPKQCSADVVQLATFSVIAPPCVFEGVRLVRFNGELQVRSPCPQARFVANARPLVLEAAKEAVRSAINELKELA